MAVKENDELIFCPCCHRICCARCLLYQEHINQYMEGSDSDMRALKSMSRRYRHHQKAIDHSAVEERHAA